MSEGTRQPESPPEVSVVQQAVVGSNLTDPVASANELHLIEALRNGDEATFVSLLDQYHSSMLRLAMMYVSNRAVAEEVVQEAWLGVLQGLERFEGRSSLRTWIFRILTNCAKTRTLREGRSVPFSSLADDNSASSDPTVDPERFLPADSPQWPGRWVSFPHDWNEIPEERLLSQETFMRIHKAIEALPSLQGAVIALRDIQGWTANEVCNFLEVTETNQRVLLHRARSKVRRMLEKYFEEE